jgi:hypothetical protein
MRVAIVAVLLSGVPQVLAADPASQATPSLSGHWIFNAKKSEDARAKMRQARGASGDNEPMNGPFFDPPPDMTIAQTADTVTIFVKDGGIRELHPKPEGSGSPRWTKDGLFVRVHPPQGHGAPRTQLFSVSKDGKELVEVVTLETPRWGPVSARRVYDAAPEQSAH